MEVINASITYKEKDEILKKLILGIGQVFK